MQVFVIAHDGLLHLSRACMGFPAATGVELVGSKLKTEDPGRLAWAQDYGNVKVSCKEAAREVQPDTVSRWSGRQLDMHDMLGRMGMGS